MGLYKVSLFVFLLGHNTLWGYTTTNSDGESVEQWADSNSLPLIHSAKLAKSYKHMEEGIQPGSHLCIFKHFGCV